MSHLDIWEKSIRAEGAAGGKASGRSRADTLEGQRGGSCDWRGRTKERKVGDEVQVTRKYIIASL